jgi:oryzin
MPVIVAAGNSAGNSTEYSPSGARLAITVGATDPSDNRAAFSNYGVGVDIFAPGVGIFSAVGACDTCYSTLDGTSMATPYVTGLSMYFMSKDKLVGPLAVLKRLVEASLPKVSAQTLMGSPNRLAYNGNGF